MPQIFLTSRDYVIDDGVFLKLGFTDMGASPDSPSDVLPLSERIDFSVSRAMGVLRADPDLGARFLGRTGGMDGRGTIYWSGDLAAVQTLSGSVGVRVAQRREGDEIVGDNRFGRFLGAVRDAYREYLRTAVIPERPVDESMVVTDFTRKGSFESDLEVREREGAQFIHTDVYHTSFRRFDTALDGTTGHASRAGGGDAAFQKFDCPFGTAYPAPLVVGSAAEASMLYERAIRGELDWKALLRGLAERGTLGKSLTERQRDAMAQEYAAQFEWMRERIATDYTLRDIPVVASSRLVPDESLGRSAYDAVHAPSPAHVLERYIQNPLLLYAPSQNGVVRALGERDHRDPQRFTIPEGTPEVTLLVIGSDTIGGREPGGKASSKLVRETRRDSSGRRYTTQAKKFEIPFKTKEETEADYRAFSARMDTLLSDIPEGTRVRLVTGSSSTMGDTVGVGTPRLVERYVKEKGGVAASWDFSRHAPSKALKEGEAPVLSAVLMDHFAECLPVLVGRSPQVSFCLDPNDEGSDVTLRERDGLAGSGAVCFSVREDTSNRNVLSMASFAADAGLPVVHVMQNWSEQTQAGMLASGALLSHAALTGNLDVEESLFLSGDRTQWDLAVADVQSYHDEQSGLDAPLVAYEMAAGVSVAGYTYHTLYGAYGALLAQETGRADRAALLRIHDAEGSFIQMGETMRDLGLEQVRDDVMERSLRRAVRLMAGTDGAFADRLLALDGRDVVIPVASGDTTLFTDLDGNGANRFGVVVAAEGRRLREQREARRVAEEQERTKMLQEASRRQQVIDQKTADGQKVTGGFPAGPDTARDAVWFLGTNSPAQLRLPDEGRSFVMWDDMGGEDRLVRAKAVSQRLDDGEGGKVDNTYVFLFPSDLASVTGRRRTSPRPDSTNLTECMRLDPKTGEKFCCAYGIPVRFNNLGNEVMNKDMLPCSYRLDNDASNYARSIVLADSQARVQAIRHGMSLCLPGRERPGGEDYYTLGQVFMDKQYTRRDGWSDNPHRSPLNLDITNRYISLLERGSRFPLNMVALPLTEYSAADDEKQRAAVEKERAEGGTRNFLSAEGRFLADLNMSLRIANATALALGVPLRFPLGPDGQIDLGPGVPEEFRVLAERKIDAFINVVREEDLSKGRLPLLTTVGLRESADIRRSGAVTKAGDIYMRPNDLVAAFGQFDFGTLLAGGVAPLHEMSFRLDDDYFFLQDSRTNRGMDISEINKYLSYEKNDERRFIVRTNNPDRLPEFTAVLKEYAARAKAVEVKMQLVQEGDPEVIDHSLQGFVNLLDSNSETFAMDEHDVGREATVGNALGRVGRDGAMEERNASGDRNGGVYYGRTDARDGFAGYAQIRYSYDGGEESPWMVVEDLELAKDIVMTLVGRKYSSMDEREVPSAKVMDLMLKAEAMKDLVARGVIQDNPLSRRKAVKADDKVVTLDEGASPVEEAAAPAARTVNVYYGTGEHRELSNLSRRPFDYRTPDGQTVSFSSVEQGFQYMKSFYSPAGEEDLEAYRRAVLSNGNGHELRSLGRTVTLDRDRWDADSEGIMRDMLRLSFDRVHNPDAVKALLDTGDAVITHVQDKSRWGEAFPRLLMEVRDEVRRSLAEKATLSSPEVGTGAESPEAYDVLVNPATKVGDIVYTLSDGGYQKRTQENAEADDVDFTFAFAVDFNTFGERATAKAAGSSLVATDIPLREGGGIDLSQRAVDAAVRSVADSLPDEFLGGEPCGVNIAGNGIYTLASRGVTQEQCDEFILKVMDGLQRKGVRFSSVRSGGQTGVDESGAVAGAVLGIPTIVHTTSDWAFRTADKKDVRSEREFKCRFEEKDYVSLRRVVTPDVKRRPVSQVKL